MSQELPKEPKFYPNENIALPYDGCMKLRYVAGRSVSRYVASENGIQEEWDELDQDGELISTIGRMVLPKEVFVAAYKKYIKDGEI